MRKIVIPSSARYINLACGDYFVESTEWANFDWLPKNQHVRQGNLLGSFQNSGQPIEMIYTSHFLEHIPVRIAEDVLRNCFEILGKKGLIRIVVPDLENICREYVKQIEKGDFEKSRFLTIELLDQLVRQTSGGLLLEQYGLASHNEELRRYISRRNGHEFRFVKERTKTKSRTKRLLRNPTLMMLHAKKLYINSILSFLPKNYRLQEISRAPFGERHHWVYDFAFLKNQLEKVGFTSVTRVSAQFSNRSDFPCFPLDIDEIGRIRKGEESMFIEAFKR